MIFHWKKALALIGAGLLLGVGLGLLILSQSGGRGELMNGLPQVFTGQAAMVGSPAPDFELTDLTGEPVHLSNLHGRPVLINFWATWCLPCKQEMPLLEDRYEKYSNELSILAVNFNEPEGDVKTYTDRLGLTFEILLDPGAKVQDLYRVRGYPTSILVDADGIIRFRQIGAFTEKQLDSDLKSVGVGE